MIFLRHPRPDIAPGTCYGRLDMDIHADGHSQIERAVEMMQPARRLIASPARRCRALATAIAERNGIEPSFDERLWEMNMGHWEGRPWSEVSREDSETWLKDPFNLRCPGGESFRDLQTRVLEALEGLDEETVVVCHAGPIRAVQMAWLGLTFREAFAQAPAYAEPLKIHPTASSKTKPASARTAST